MHFFARASPPPGQAGGGVLPAVPEKRSGKALQVLVVGTSPVNRIVISKIAERAGLRTVSELPDEALKVLETEQPAMVIADGGASNDECNLLLCALRDRRRGLAAASPAVILLCTAASDSAQLASRHGVDAVVAKPITPDRLQPVIERLLASLRKR